MLANPIVIPIYAVPLTWAVAAVAMWAEIAAIQALLRRMGLDVAGLEGRLLVIQICTWVPFLIGVDWASSVAPGREGWPILALELAVVVVETPLLVLAVRGWSAATRRPAASMTWTRALLASVVGNFVSAAVSLGGPLVLIWAFGGFAA